MGKEAELFNICGLISPFVSRFKIDLHDLVTSSYGWDDPISEVEREKWITNFQMMSSISDVLWPRVVIPNDAESTEMELIGTGDASQHIACSACYVRLNRRMDPTYAN